MIGQGIYQLSDVASLTGIPAATVRSWFKRRSDGAGHGPLFQSDYPVHNGEYAVSFLNLIEAYSAKFFRNEGVKPPMIRRAYELLSKELGPHPFARGDLCTDGVCIIAEKMTKTREQILVDAVSGQRLLELRTHLGEIVYARPDSLASLWKIYEGVLVDPRANLGKPVLEGSYIPTIEIARQFQANDKNAALVSKLFRITEKEVIRAFDFEKQLHRNIAA